MSDGQGRTPGRTEAMLFVSFDNTTRSPVVVVALDVVLAFTEQKIGVRVAF